jgi:hypothetical protein
MISRLKVVIVAVLVSCSCLASVSHAQQRQGMTQAVQLIGLAGVEEKAKGKLTVLNGTLRFVYAKGNADVATAAIQDVVTGTDSQRVIGGTLGTLTLLAPFGSGRALSLFRTKLDTLTIKYRDGNGALHGVVFTMPQGEAERIKKDLIAQGAHTSITAQVNQTKTPAEAAQKL